jgi:hypothetical protein
MKLSQLSDSARRAQPAWSMACLELLQELVNRRLFSQVREKKGLSYDANFQVRVNGIGGRGGYWVAIRMCILCLYVCLFLCQGVEMRYICKVKCPFSYSQDAVLIMMECIVVVVE